MTKCESYSGSIIPPESLWEFFVFRYTEYRDTLVAFELSENLFDAALKIRGVKVGEDGVGRYAGVRLIMRRDLPDNFVNTLREWEE